MSLLTRVGDFGMAAVFGPLMFLNGVPEYGPHRPATAQILGGLVGTAVWIALLNELLTVIL